MVSSISNDTTAAAAAMKKSTGMNKDDFMKLFVTQLQNQDPMKPQDSSQFVAQLAQLTQVEQAYNSNTNLQALQTAMNGSANLTAVSFIGKDIMAKGDTVDLKTGGQPVLGFRLPYAADRTVLEIRDAAGGSVRTLDAGKSVAGDFGATWNGMDNNGKILPPGKYNYTVTGYNADKSSFDAIPLVTGKVDGVKMDGGKAIFTSGSLEIPIADLLKVKGVI